MNEGEIMAFQNKQTLKQFVIIRPVLQKMFQDMPHIETQIVIIMRECEDRKSHSENTKEIKNKQ